MALSDLAAVLMYGCLQQRRFMFWRGKQQLLVKQSLPICRERRPKSPMGFAGNERASTKEKAFQVGFDLLAFAEYFDRCRICLRPNRVAICDGWTLGRGDCFDQCCCGF